MLDMEECLCFGRLCSLVTYHCNFPPDSECTEEEFNVAPVPGDHVDLPKESL